MSMYDLCNLGSKILLAVYAGLITNNFIYREYDKIVKKLLCYEILVLSARICLLALVAILSLNDYYKVIFNIILLFVNVILLVITTLWLIKNINKRSKGK